MNILFLTHNVAFHGGATFFRALHLGEGFAKRGHSVTLIASSAKKVWGVEHQQIQGLTLVRMPGLAPTRLRYGYDPYETLWRCLWVARHKFDLVHAFDSRPTVIYPALTAQRGGSLLALDWCDWFGRNGAVEERKNPLVKAILRPLETYYEEAFRRQADLTTVINQSLLRRALSLGISPGTIHLLPNGSDIDKISAIKKNRARSALGLPEAIPILGYMGSLFQADADLLIEAFQQVKLKLPDALLILIGNPKAVIPKIKGVVQTGYVSQEAMNLYLCASDLLLIPQIDSVANRGRWPSKLNDYLAAGRPVVVSAVGDVAQMVEKEAVGLATPANIAGFTAGILTMLENSKEMIEAGVRARLLAEKKFSWDLIVNGLEAHYKSAMANQKKVKQAYNKLPG